MADLEDTAVDWESGVYQIETSDPVLGGAPNIGTGAGMTNIPHLQLAKRTIWLKAQIDALISDLADLAVADVSGLSTALALKANLASPPLTGNPTAPTAAQFDNDTSIATTAFVQRALGNYRAAETAAANFTLQPEDAGKTYICTQASAITITLPSFASVVSGGCYTIINTGTANVTIQRAGSDTIDNGPGSVTSMVIPPNMSLTLIKGGTSWHPISLTSQSLAFSFGSSLGSSGWQRLPSGMIIQWGGYSIGTGGGASQSVSFPITFPTAIMTAWIGTDTGATEMTGTQSRTVSGMTVSKGASDSGFARTGFWFAMGY